MNDDNDTPARPLRKGSPTALKGAAAERRAAQTARSHGTYIPKPPCSHGNVVYIEEWLMRVAGESDPQAYSLAAEGSLKRWLERVAEERHAAARSPAAKATIERWMMRNPAFVPGDDVPA